MQETTEKTSQKLIPLSKWNSYYDYPTVGALRQLLFKGAFNGFDKVIRKIGNRIYINVDDFFAWVDSTSKKY